MNNHSSTLKRQDVFKDGRLLPPFHVMDQFMTKTPLKESFIMQRQLMVYNPSKGIYELFTERHLETFILKTFEDLNLRLYTTRAYINNLTWFIITKGRLVKKSVNYKYLTFNNGNLNLETFKLEPLSPEIVSVSYIDTHYDADARPLMFIRFLKTTLNDDVINFLRAVIISILRADTRAQVFIYFQGPGGTGKSTFVNILSVLVGEESTVTTTLRDLNTDKFEGSNLVGKRLIVVNDTEGFKGDLQVLKAVTGGDSIQGRTKFEGGSFEVRPQGTVVISGNQPLLTKDSSGALARRLRLITMDKIPSEEVKKPLLYKEEGSWKGPLADEVSGIINWSRMSRDEAFDLLSKINLTPGLVVSHKVAVELMNPLINWVQEELEPSGGAYLGFTTKTTPEALLHSVRQLRTLYPCYLLYCKRSGSKPLSLKTFSPELITTCNTLNIKVKKIKKREGAFIEGLSIKSEILRADYQAGAPMTSEEPVTDLKQIRSSNDSSTTGVKQEVYYRDFEQGIERHTELYEDYIRALGKSDLKVQLNKAARTFKPNPGALVDEHIGLLSGLKGVEISHKSELNPSEYYREHMKGIMAKGIYKVNTSIVPYKYKPMGLSPRLLPQNYGDSFNSVKRFLRQKAYVHVCPNGYEILDIDLKSCYTSILLGLFPLELFAIKKAVDKGLWKHLEQQFVESNRAGVFNKPAVKICTYSSLFGGGPNAMINGTMDFMRKEMGMRPDEFRQSRMYESCHALARDVSEFMNTTDVVQDFREISKFVKLTYEGKTIIGPTGHRYVVDEHNFRSSYPNFLQSYEFYLLAMATLIALKLVPEAQLIGHFHDGNVVIVPSGKAMVYLKAMDEALDELTEGMRLAYPQKVEAVVYESATK